MNSTAHRQHVRKSKRLMERHPQHIPVIIKPSNLQMTTVKFLPHKESTVAELMLSVRNYATKLKKTDGLLFFVANKMPPVTMQIGELYKEYANSDGYLHVIISRESTFG
jgi:hypothetical protein